MMGGTRCHYRKLHATTSILHVARAECIQRHSRRITPPPPRLRYGPAKRCAAGPYGGPVVGSFARRSRPHGASRHARRLRLSGFNPSSLSRRGSNNHALCECAQHSRQFGTAAEGPQGNYSFANRLWERSSAPNQLPRHTCCTSSCAGPRLRAGARRRI